MRHFDQHTPVIATILLMSGCASPGPSTSASELKSALTTKLAAAATVPTDKSPTGAGLGDPDVRAKLRAVALQASSYAGVAQPPKMNAVAVTDHQAAETLLSGANVNDHSPVYVIKMTGSRFTSASHPPGVPAPQGNVLTVTVDATNYRITDLGIVDVEPDLTKLGPTIVDLGTP